MMMMLFLFLFAVVVVVLVPVFDLDLDPVVVHRVVVRLVLVGFILVVVVLVVSRFLPRVSGTTCLRTNRNWAEGSGEGVGEVGSPSPACW